MYHLPGNVIFATVGLVCINLQLKYVLPRSTRFGQFRKFGKIGVGAPSSPATPKEAVSARGRVLVRGYLCIRFDLLKSINFRDISGFPKLEAHNFYWGSPQRV